jgi:hypothetical protein
MSLNSNKILVKHKLVNMKMIKAIFFAGMLIVTASSCKKQLDINTDPNVAVGANPQLVLPQALTGTASNMNGFNSMGAQLGGYSANAGGYGGFGTSITYNFSASDFSGRFTTTYDNLEDYQYIINYSKGNPLYSYFEGAAKAMKVLNFQLLVDTYNDVPYTEALQGAAILTPKYDPAVDIYKSLANECDSAMASFVRGDATPGVTPLSTYDVMFKGSVANWKKFINTLKLRIILRGKSKVTFANTTFTADGFLTTDALINPGYTRDNNRQNPKWNQWGFGYTGSDATKSWMPNKFVMAFYDGTKLTDPGRGAAIYYKFPATGTNQLGVEGTAVQASPAGSFWYSNATRTGSTSGAWSGPLKGPSAGYPVITAAESYFLQAEAGLTGVTSSNPQTSFDAGVAAAFKYTYTLENGTATSADPAAAVTKYQADNSTSYLVNFGLATTTAQKLEAIITQKYIACNFVNSEEGWNEYRRTGYPLVVPGGPAYATFASTVSESTRADKLPARVLYPSQEGSYNSANVPKGITPFTSTIFWAK